jgi:23S rRNA pseudouridine1911/1915/1917 synthase
VQKLFEVIFEDTDLLVINKSAGLVCHPTKGDEWSSLIGRLRLYLGAERPAHLINRLDRETSGVVLAAKNPEAAGQLGKLWESRAVEKEYLAIVHGAMRRDAGLIDFPLGKDEASQVAVKHCVRRDGAAALTEFRVERRFRRAEGEFTLLRVLPKTGRKHQIRIHLAAVGHPVVGDKLYGGDEDLYLALAQNRLTAGQRQKLLLTNQALHAFSMRFNWRGEGKFFQAPPDADFMKFAGDLEVFPNRPTVSHFEA